MWGNFANTESDGAISQVPKVKWENFMNVKSYGVVRECSWMSKGMEKYSKITKDMGEFRITKGYGVISWMSKGMGRFQKYIG